MIDAFKESIVKETNARYFGMSEGEMIDNAGKALAKRISEFVKKDSVVSIVCGLGNNGADGMACARFLKKAGYDPKVLIIGREKDIKSEAAEEHFKLLKKEKVEYLQDAYAKDIVQSDVVVEALLGVGVKGVLRKRFKDVVNKISRMRAKKIAIDFPVPGYKPDLILSLISAKRKTAEVLDIGLPKQVDEYVGPGHVKFLQKPKKDSYKSKNGELLVFGGSDLFHGAPLMATMAASKFIGSVFFYTCPANRELVKDMKIKLQEFIVLRDEDLEKYSGYANVILAGPGLEDNVDNKSTLTYLLNSYPEKVFVLDAYAIAMANPENNPQNKRGFENCILTPHRGELRHIFKGAKMTGLEGKLRRFCIENKCDLVLKGSTDLLFSAGGEFRMNKTGNPGMAKGGTGDVLSGMVAALACKNDPWEAVMAGTFLNGVAGDEARKEFGYNFSATDLIPYLQKAYKWAEGF